jgi:hypothetical protein
VAPLVFPHDPDGPEALPLEGADRPNVRGGRVDRQATMPADLEQEMRDQRDGLGVETQTLVRRIEEEVDARVTVVGEFRHWAAVRTAVLRFRRASTGRWRE